MANSWCWIFAACVLVASACSPPTTVPADRSAQVLPGGTHATLVELHEAASRYVASQLPGAYLWGGVALRARCDDLPNLRGQLGLGWIQVHSLFFGIDRQLVTANGWIDTDTAQLDVTYADSSRGSWILDRASFPGDEQIRSAAKAAYDYITPLGIPDCVAHISRPRSDYQQWMVTCRPEGQPATRACRFRVEPDGTTSPEPTE